MSDKTNPTLNCGPPLPPDAQPAETCVVCKSTALAAVLQDHALMESIGCGWRLFMLLVLLTAGRMVGTWDDIGEAMGTNASTARKWAGRLKTAGVVVITPKGKRVDVGLTERYMAIAQTPDTLPATPELPARDADTPRMVRLRQLADIADEAGIQLEVRMIV